jgi:hypothetical protein
MLQSALPERTVKYALKPLSLAELLDRTFSIYRRHFVLFLGISVVPNLLTLVATLFLLISGLRQSNPFLLPIALIATLFVYSVATVFVQGATVVAVSQIQLGRNTSVAEAFGAIRPRLVALLGLTLNIGVRTMLGLLLFIIPGIVVWLMYSLAIPVAVLEGKTVSQSLKRSAALTKGHRGRIFLIYFLLFVLVAGVTALWQAPIAVLMFGHARNTPTPISLQIITEFGNFATRSFLGPIVTIALAVVYYDERVRKEAFDLEHMMQELDSLPIEPPAAA